MNFLVTGGAGFIGSHLTELLLAKGHQVVALDNFSDAYDPRFKRRNVATLRHHAKFTLVEGDLCDPRAIGRVFRGRKFDQIIHLAARAGVRPSLLDPLLYSHVNVNGTIRILEAARHHGIKKFIFGSTSSIYGMRQNIPFREEDPVFRPISPYAATKLAGEALCHTYHHLYGLDVVCLRFFTVYGPRQRPDLVIFKFAKALTADHPLEVFGDGSSRRDYTYVGDIARGIYAATRRQFGYEVINLGGNRTIPLLKMIRLLEQALGKKGQLKHLPAQPGDVPLTSAAITKAKRLLGWQPQVKFEEGIQRFADWFNHEKIK